MTYIPTPLKREIVIDSIITIHYFEYMRDFVFQPAGNNNMQFSKFSFNNVQSW